MDLLKKLYEDPKTGYSSITKLYAKAKAIDSKITRKLVKEFIENNTTEQLHKRKIESLSGFPIVGAVGHYQVDLTFLSQYKGQNRGYHIILVCVEVNSKYAYTRALKNKNQDTIISAISEIIQQAKKEGRPITFIQSDNGTEFKNKKMESFLKKESIKQSFCQAGDKKCLSIAERFNRTIKNYLNKWMTANDSVVWYDKLQDFTSNYNNTFHSSIKNEPINVSEFEEKIMINDKLETIMKLKAKQKIKVGDTVRIPIKKTTFAKEQQNFSNKVYIVKKIGLANLEVEGLNKKIPINSVQIVSSNTQEHTTNTIKQAKKSAKIERRIRSVEQLEPNYDEENIRITKPRLSKLKSYQTL